MDSGSALEYFPVGGGSYYGYYPTAGTEQAVVMEDHHSNADLQDIYYPNGLQNAGMQYTYVNANPGYGYPQSSYNHYNPYIPSAVAGTDSQFIGTQQYITNPPYEQFVPSPAYIPANIPSTFDNNFMHSTQVPCIVNNGMPSAGPAGCRTDNVGAQPIPYYTPANPAAPYQRVTIRHPVLEEPKLQSHPIHASANVPNGSFIQAADNNQYLSHGSAAVGTVAHAGQVIDNFSNLRISSGQIPANSVYTNFGSIVPCSNPVTTYKPRFPYNRALTNGRRTPNVLGDQHRGPRSNASTLEVQTPSQNGNLNGTISKYVNQFNKEDFVIDYPVAKFFVIKSYTEDDVHKSIKYNVWSSTPYGNKKLDNAYEDAQRLSMGKPRYCPVFLFFSVNASGRFCGVAEMVGRVDFTKNMDFWHQDKWIGSFPVKWHVIKDVPNTSLRHILLDNNEFIPVTSSRDTQEVTYLPGRGMLEIFKHHMFFSNLLDDFMYYEEKEKLMREERSRLLGRNPAADSFVPRSGNSKVRTVTVEQPKSFYRPVSSNGKEQSHETVESPKEVRPKEKHLNGNAEKSSRAVSSNLEDNNAVKQHPLAGGKLQNGSLGNGSAKPHPETGGKSHKQHPGTSEHSKANPKQPNGSTKYVPKANGKVSGRGGDQRKNVESTNAEQIPSSSNSPVSAAKGDSSATDSFTVGTMEVQVDPKNSSNPKKSNSGPTPAEQKA